MSNPIYLAEACQNTFLIADCINSTFVTDEFLDAIHAHLVESKRDDALLLVNGQSVNGFLITDMVVLGADKQLGDFCGNGARACAAYLYDKYPQYKEFYLRGKKNNLLLTQHDRQNYSVDLPAVNFALNQKFISDEHFFKLHHDFYLYAYQNKIFYYSDMMEPHLILNEALSADEVELLGQELNKDSRMFPMGINLTVYHSKNNILDAVTFERGVQRLTRSCGTGACCVAAFYLKGKTGTVRIKNPGGILNIYNQKNGVRLQGPGLVTGRLN